MEWVEVKGKTVEVAVEAALAELQLGRDAVDIEVIEQPERGFLGMGGRDALVRVKPRPQEQDQKKRRRRRKRSDRPGGSSDDGGGRSQDNRSGGGESRSSGGGRNRSGGQGGNASRNRSGDDRSRQQKSNSGSGKDKTMRKDDVPEVSVEDQVPMVESFLGGLVNSFGLEGGVDTKVVEDVIVADVTGEQTEALVGVRGSTIEAIHELTKTVLQRQTRRSARVRLDVAGFAERRRQALAIYANQLIDQVLEDGGELVLEPMSASDRKVVHDVAASRDGVSSYSEGEAPRRYVVLTTAKSGKGSSEEE